MNRLWLATVALFVGSTGLAANEPAVRLYSAGSLRAAMTDISAAYTQSYGVRVDPVYGPSGGLRDRLGQGEPGDVFTSADMGYPQALGVAGLSGPTVLFARNHLCAMLRPGLTASPKNLLATLLRPDVKIGTSDPENDPGGTYAWAMFKRAEAAKPGSRAKLEAKTRTLGNGPGSLNAPPNTKNALAWLFRERKLDAFIAYCTGGPAAAESLPGISTLNLPPELAVAADYGLTILKSANQSQAAQFALFILSPLGQKILAEHGFDAPLQSAGPAPGTQ